MFSDGMASLMPLGGLQTPYLFADNAANRVRQKAAAEATLSATRSVFKNQQGAQQEQDEAAAFVDTNQNARIAAYRG